MQKVLTFKTFPLKVKTEKLQVRWNKVSSCIIVEFLHYLERKVFWKLKESMPWKQIGWSFRELIGFTLGIESF